MSRTQPNSLREKKCKLQKNVNMQMFCVNNQKKLCNKHPEMTKKYRKKIQKIFGFHAISWTFPITRKLANYTERGTTVHHSASTEPHQDPGDVVGFSTTAGN